ncbi:alpha/beta hydrolase [Frankia sp. CNm7]|uniref:Alpha/beta hydrolase n=1 Tax=Frankia nepalensis TaxID=1836974 RepID=A0A937RJY2_9ACTN|nr:alpha/beta hydrolase [Frankia nepalensis]MBL7496403.1 alpha/beta hydrolase [Frankia nepalensis]MBL7511447.1 alpha/beta hydrolase [Frankia nepalensis]MBL7523592.1 alpha/beta hydrolase [Frankia nepalensis]MBL7627311.1 alpha/beta hydrolase [Frankia nepalensis]
MLEGTSARVRVDDVAPAGAAEVSVRIVRDPDRTPERPVVLCCFAGGGMSARYFELAGAGRATRDEPAHAEPGHAQPGHAQPGYDMAAYLAAAGLVVVLVDHLATGGSDTPADPWALVPETVADVDAAAAARAVAGLGLVDPVVLGLGHSMGGMLVALAQARHRPYAGLVLLGHSGRGWPEMLGPGELAVAGDPVRARASVADLARARFGRALVPSSSGVLELLVGPGLPPAAAAALAGCADSLITPCGLASMIPGSHRDALAAIDVPVLIGLAEHDIAGPPREAPGYLPGCPDVTLHVLAGAYHNSNVAPGRAELWDRIVDWAIVDRVTDLRVHRPSPAPSANGRQYT